MTIEKVCFVAPEDFRAVKIACKQCGSFTVVPLDDVSAIAPLLERNCIGCGTPSGFARDTEEWKSVLLLSENLAALKAKMQARNVAYSLQIDCPSVQ